MTYRRSIQALRGIAVLVVLGYHFGIPGFKNGFLGVDVFFVISGFLMAHIYQGKSIREFYTRRAKRLIPAYLMTILLTCIFGFFRLVPNDFKQLIDQTKSAIILSPNIFFWFQNSYFQKTNFNPLLNLWSLGVEFHFYLIVPLIYIAQKNWKLANKSIFLISIICCVGIIVISPKTSFFLIPFRLWEFLAGVLIAEIHFRRFSKSFHVIGNWILISSLIFLFTLFPVNGFSQNLLLGHPGIASFFTVFITSILIGANSDFLTGSRTLDQPLEWLGKYSYSLYLIHFPLLSLLNYKPFSGTILNSDSNMRLILIVILTFILGIAQYHFIEQRFRRVANIRKVIVISLICILSINFFAQRTHFLRFSPYQNNISHAMQEIPKYRCGKLFRLTHPTEKLCNLNHGSNQKRFLLLGNSHADAIKATFLEVAKIRGVSVFFFVSNNPLSIQNQEIMGLAKDIQAKGISDVFIHFAPGSVDLEKLSTLLKNLKGLGINCHIFGPVPTYDEGVPTQLWNKVTLGIMPKSQNYKQYVLKNNEELLFLRNNLSQDADYYDVASQFCKPKCLISDLDYRPYYSDASHLTFTGAQKLTPLIITAIESAIKN
jgi:peptidoglycan/LPS O-acetylase OafA/YrhL